MAPKKAKHPNTKRAKSPQPERARSAPVARIGARKSPKQERSRAMVEAILEAAAELFADLGYARATTNKIAARAGVSVGSLYQYFPNKDSLLAGLLAQHHEEVHVVLEDALVRLADHDVPIEEGIRELVFGLMAVHEANPALTRALSAAVLRESPAADHIHDKDELDLLQRVVAVLDTRPDVRAGDHVAMAALLGQVMAHLSRWLAHDAPGPMTATLVEETVQLLTRFLRR